MEKIIYEKLDELLRQFKWKNTWKQMFVIIERGCGD